MTGPRPKGLVWTLDNDRALGEMMEADMDKAQVACNLKRTVAAVRSRWTRLQRARRQEAK